MREGRGGRQGLEHPAATAGEDEPPRPIGVGDDAELTCVMGVVVVRAQGDEVVEVGAAAIGPVHDVVDVDVSVAIQPG